MLKLQKPEVYTDFNGLAELKYQAKEKAPETIQKVARQFESVFVNMMLKSMRQAKLSEGILDSKQSEFYQDMYDQQLSLHLAEQGGIGLADVIAEQLSPQKPLPDNQAMELADFQRRMMIRPVETPAAETQNLLSGKVLPTGKIAETGKIQSREDFVAQLRPQAQQAAKVLGVDANLLLAQAALETGWGQFVIASKNGKNSHNLFNIKADKSWQGDQNLVETLEYNDGQVYKEMAGFRAYDSYADSFNDYVEFIQNNPRYQKALKVTEKVERYMHELQQAGYATDPQYANKVLQIYQTVKGMGTEDTILADRINIASDNS